MKRRYQYRSRTDVAIISDGCFIDLLTVKIRCYRTSTHIHILSYGRITYITVMTNSCTPAKLRILNLCEHP